MTTFTLVSKPLLVFLCIAGPCTAIAMTTHRYWKTAYSSWAKGFSHLWQLHQVPCHRCQYFTGDHRLKCTVWPSLAGTIQAIDCQDYQVRPSQNIDKVTEPIGCQWYKSIKSNEKQYH